MIKRYLVPPAGTPTTAADLAATLRRRLAGRGAAGEFAAGLRALTGAAECYLFGSGRAALALALRALARLSARERDEVVIPAYTCFTVPAAVVRAGLRIRIVDIDPRTLDYDFGRLEAADLSRAVAVVGCNLLGIASDWRRLRAISEKSGCYLVDDAAQALGTATPYGPAGSSGHVGVLSFGRGKNLSTYAGGALVTSEPRIAEAVAEIMKTVPSPGGDAAALAKIALYAALLHPKVYWLPAGLSFLGLGKTVFEPDFEIRTLGAIPACAGATLLPKLEAFNRARERNAGRLAEALACAGKLEIPGRDGRAAIAYLRLPVLFHDRWARDGAIAALRGAGISASTLYPSTTRRIAGIEKLLASDADDFPGARDIVERMAVLPTHPLLRDSDIDRMIACLIGGGR